MKHCSPHHIITSTWNMWKPIIGAPPHRPVVTSYYKSPVGTRYRLKMKRRTKQRAKSKIRLFKCVKEHIPIFWFQIICSGMRGKIIGDHYIKQDIRFLCVRSFHFRSSKGSGAVFYSDPVERSYFFSGVKKIWSSASDKALSALW